jgi:hypothetical protein
MSRIRSVHPGLFTDESFMSASAHARLLMIGLWVEAWDDGVFEWKSLTLKAKLFPVDNVDVGALLAELTALNVVRQFHAGGKTFGAIRNFRKFQRPKKPNSSKVLPADLEPYVGELETTPELVPNHSPTGGENPPQMEDGGGREGGEIKIFNRGKPAREFRAFPADGSIAYVEPYVTIARTHGRGADPDILASNYRKFCHAQNIPFDDPRQPKTFTTFCGKHKVQGLHS